MSTTSFVPAALIPVYNHHKVLEEIVTGLESLDLPVILVDDGSDAECARALDTLAARHAKACLVRRAENGGKGAAVVSGLYTADNMGFTHVIQIDADGQHDLTKVTEFLEVARANPQALVCGYPVYDRSVPLSRLWGRELTNFWVHVNTGSKLLKDAMCGFRVYPLAGTLKVLPTVKTRRMDFDPDIAVRLIWSGMPVVNRPVGVTYPKDGISHFRAFSDNVRISRLHTVHFFTRLAHLTGLTKGPTSS